MSNAGAALAHFTDRHALPYIRWQRWVTSLDYTDYSIVSSKRVIDNTFNCIQIDGVVLPKGWLLWVSFIEHYNAFELVQV